MKRQHLVHHLRSHGCIKYREGRKHTLYLNPINNKITTIPRHIELNDYLARKICRDLDIPIVFPG